MNFEKLAHKVCTDRGLVLLSNVSKHGYYAVRNAGDERPYPLAESRLAAWVQAEVDKRTEKVKESFDKAVEQNGEGLKRLADRDVITVSEDGEVQLDFNNPKHVEIAKKWNREGE